MRAEKDQTYCMDWGDRQTLFRVLETNATHLRATTLESVVVNDQWYERAAVEPLLAALPAEMNNPS